MHKKQEALLFPVILLIAFPQLNETIYAIALPGIEQYFQLNKALLRYTLTSYLIGFGLGTLLWGYLSDLIGRRKSIISGVIFYVLGCLLCAKSNSLNSLLIARFVQGVGISFASVMGQTLIRDFIPQSKRLILFNRINIILSFIPAIGLVLGIFMVRLFAWQWIFFLFGIISIIILISAAIFIPKIQTTRSGKRLYLKCLRQFIFDIHGLRLGFFVGGSLGILFGYFSASIYFFKEVFGVSDINFIIISLFLSVALYIGALISQRTNYNASDKIFFSIITQAIFASVFYFLVKVEVITPTNQYGLLLSILFAYAVVGSIMIIIPNCLSSILNEYGKYIGTASSVYGFYYYIITACFISVFNFIDIKSIEGLPGFMLLSTCFLFCVLLVHHKEKLKKVFC